ncbi:AMP-binding protein [Candidatus Micrarchaeota archaeon]|nr:AMP-binding protein [Candidatus Micrarchaeota archaeon]
MLDPAYGAAKLTNAATSGSSGNTVKISMDRNNQAWRIATGFAVTTEFGRSPKDLLVEITSRPHVQSPLLAAAGVFRHESLSLFEREESNYSRIREMKPDILGRHPSTMALMAEINDKAGRPVALKAVYCTGEQLCPGTRKAVSSSFSCPVFNHYGTTETGSVAFECPEEHSLHVHPSSIVEIVSDQDKPLQKGVGEVIVTSLESLAMPFLRYRVGDRACWGEDCPCGRGLPVLGRIEGRSGDFLHLPSGNKIAARFLDLIAYIDGIPRHQVEQKSENLIVFRYASSAGLHAKARERVIELFRRGCRNENVSVEFEQVDCIRKESSGKTRQFIPLCRPNHLK